MHNNYTHVFAKTISKPRNSKKTNFQHNYTTIKIITNTAIFITSTQASTTLSLSQLASSLLPSMSSTSPPLLDHHGIILL